MKHIFTKAIVCMATLLLTSSLWAQDIIVTTDSKKIEAKILEVSDTEIKYKEKDYLDGPTFVMSTNKISSVLYSNGKVVLYNQSPAAEKKEEPQQVHTSVEQPVVSSAPSIDENTAEVLLLSGNTLTVQMTEMKSNYIAYVLNGKAYTMPASQIEKVTFVQNGQVREYNGRNTSIQGNQIEESSEKNIANSSNRIYRDNGEYMRNNTYISSREVVRILKQENNAAYKKWKEADAMVISGGVFGIVGAGFLIGSIFPFIRKDFGTALGLDCAALVSEGIAIGLLFGAKSRYNRAIDIYNSKYDNTAITLRWGITPNGIGLAFAF